jgi:hypothetical protein
MLGPISRCDTIARVTVRPDFSSGWRALFAGALHGSRLTFAKLNLMIPAALPG